MEFDPKERQKYLGGSDIGAILGVNPYRSKHEVYIQKVTDNPTEVPESERMYWGSQLEESVLRRWNRDRRFKRLGVVSASHPNMPFMKGHPDAMYQDDTGKRYIIEVKTTDKDNAKLWEDGPPSYYYYQLAFYAMIINRNLESNMATSNGIKYYFAVLIGGNEYREYAVDIQDSDMDYVEEQATEFWLNHVTPKILPEYDEPTKAINAHLFPDHDGSGIEADQFMKELVDKYRNLKKSAKALCDEADRLKEVIKNKIGHNSYMSYDGKKIASVSSYNKKYIDWKSVADTFKEHEHFDAIVEESTKTTNITTLR